MVYGCPRICDSVPKEITDHTSGFLRCSLALWEVSPQSWGKTKYVKVKVEFRSHMGFIIHEKYNASYI